MFDLWIDCETTSPIDLKRHGLMNYHEKSTVIVISYAVDYGEVVVLTGQQPMDAVPYNLRLHQLMLKAKTIYAHNAAFDRLALKDYPTPLTKWTCTAALARAHGLAPSSLDALSRFFGLPSIKDVGKEIMKKGQQGTRWAEFCEYAKQDVILMRTIAKLLPRFSWSQSSYVADQEINDRGFAVDVELAQRIATRLEELQESAVVECQMRFGFSPRQVERVRAALGVQNLRAETLRDYVPDSPDREALLSYRQLVCNASGSKYQTLVDRAYKGRIHHGLEFCGAATTGRWAGRGFQPQNLPRPQHPLSALDDLFEQDSIEFYKRSRSLVRAMLTGPLVVADYSAIEGRVLAWLAGEKWKLGVYKSGGDLYVETYRRMTGHEGEVSKSQRFVGKVAELALGYQGGAGALERMCSAYGATLDEDYEIIKHRWRKASPETVKYWWKPHIESENALYDTVRLVSGRKLVYWHGDDGHYKTPSQVKSRDCVQERYYGGKFVENIVQATARDIMMSAIHRVKGHVVLTVHDELVCTDTIAPRELEEAMCKETPWLKGLPLAVQAERVERYFK